MFNPFLFSILEISASVSWTPQEGTKLWCSILTYLIKKRIHVLQFHFNSNALRTYGTYLPLSEQRWPSGFEIFDQRLLSDDLLPPQ